MIASPLLVAAQIRLPSPDRESVRHILSHYVAAGDAIAADMPDYAHLDRPRLEVYTIDAAQVTTAKFGGRVEVLERKTVARENIRRARKLGLKNLPAPLINGELKFSSIIPNRKELEAEIERYL
jgi:uroporphyrinogen decarboxylase